LAGIINWANNEEPVRALILEGSRGSKNPPDELADFDINVFATTHEPYTQDDGWLSTIGEVWVYSPDKYEWNSEIIPTRLVIFKGGVKVDFSFISIEMLNQFANSTYLDLGYTVLLDKDGKTDELSPPTYGGLRPARPTEDGFTSLVREFWFEAYHVAKYLKREELWLVKARDWATKEFLLKMIEWHAHATHEADYRSSYLGKHMKSWIDKGVWRALHRTFAHFDKEDSWNGLLETIHLFRRLASETAESFGFAYPDDVDRNITGFILKLKEAEKV
jgi:aminoglycoside 6-adenylyltransferase